MKNRFTIFFLTISISSFGQMIIDSSYAKSDSIVVKKISDKFVEVKSLRHVLIKSYSPPHSTAQIKKDKSDRVLSGVYISENYIPSGPKLKDGIVIIKNRNDFVIGMKYYKDSVLVLWEEYENHILNHQEYLSPSDSTDIDKYFYSDGRLQSIYYFNPRTGKRTIKYSEKGEITVDENE